MGKLFERYLVLVVFVGVWLVGIVIRYGFGTQSWLWDLWSTVDVAFAVALGVMAFLAYREFIRAEDEVSIYFEIDGVSKNTGLKLLRKDFTRSEIQGVLGMIQKDPAKRYSVSYMKKRKFLQDLNQLQKGKSDVFILPLSGDEFEQFEIA